VETEGFRLGAPPPDGASAAGMALALTSNVFQRAAPKTPYRIDDFMTVPRSRLR
jgi:hypothetical protein